MAILKKRTSSKQIPEARALNRAPLSSVIQGVKKAPSISGGSSPVSGGSSSVSDDLSPASGGSSSITSAGSGSRPFTSTSTGNLTSTTGSKPAVTNTTSKTPTSITTSPSTVPKQTVKPKTTNPNSVTSKVVNALSGAALGAGTKLLVDKFSSKPNISKPPAQVAAEKAAIKASAPTSVVTNADRKKAETAKQIADKKAAEQAAEKLANSAVKPPVEDEFITDKDGNLYKVMPDGSEVLVQKAEKPVEDEFSTDEKGNVYKVMPDGTEILYRAAEVSEDEFTTDSLGNIYKTMPDGTSVLYRAAETEEDTSVYPPNTGGNLDTVAGMDASQIAPLTPDEPDFEPEYFEDSLGNVYISTPDGEYDLYRAAEVEEDVDAFPPNTVGEETSFEPEYFEDSLGNIYVSTADGGYDLYRAAEVEDDFAEQPAVDEEQYYDDGNGNIYVQNDSGEYELYRAAEVPEDIVEEDYDLFNGDNTDYYDYNDYIDYQPDERYSTFEDDGDEYYDYKRGGLITMMKQGGIAHMADGGYMPDGAVDNGDGTYSIGNFTYDMMTDEYLYSTDSDSGNITNVSTDAIYSPEPEEDYYDTDSLGNIYKNGEFYRAAEADEDITSAGSGDRSWYSDLGSALSKGLTGATKLGSDALSGITGALGTTAGAAGAGALVATLLGSDFGGDPESQNQGLDMSKVGVINPRTTDFGIGPTRFVGYEDYGTGGGEYVPNEELLRNLNAPGFNPVREGDYGYEEVAAEEPVEEAPKMASGGLSSMATPVASYYTFGQPADILANLGMRPQPPMNPPEMMPQIGQQQQPQQAQQQGLPQQQPPQMKQQAPQGMPQQGIMPQQQGMAPPMRKGGLPHVSDVPLTQGRMDFRKGAAVHGEGDGQSDDIPAMLADGEYVIDAETVAQIGNGSTKAGAQALDKFRESIRAHKRSAPINKIPPKTKVLTSYLKGAR